MKLKLIRKYKCPNYTIGHLYINDKYFCDTLEDKVRQLDSIEDKIKHKTAIPEGKYKVVVTMSPKFKRLLPLLLNVPFFEGIRIHRGNDENDTSGCIIVGENKIKGKVINS
ncbi:MAG: hypothetical protein GX921_02220, partial [Bacteroidales bacterium]|nr:hypothetical protein [Bacteroidales bacterium]